MRLQDPKQIYRGRDVYKPAVSVANLQATQK